jgi:hypothetical protein
MDDPEISESIFSSRENKLSLESVWNVQRVIECGYIDLSYSNCRDDSKFIDFHWMIQWVEEHGKLYLSLDCILFVRQFRLEFQITF